MSEKCERMVQLDHPMKVAWDDYSESDDYKNTRKWALRDAHVDGSLWAAFCAGWFCRETNTVDHKPTIHELEEILDSEPAETVINQDGSVTAINSPEMGKDRFTLAEKTALHICRNPFGRSDEEQRKARNDVCGFFESARDAYLNMRQWAKDNGVDTTAYHGP